MPQLNDDDMRRLQSGEHINPEPDIEAMLRSGKGWGRGDWSNPPASSPASAEEIAYLRSLKVGDQFVRVIDGSPMDWLVVREIRDDEIVCDRQTGGAGGFQVTIGLPRERRPELDSYRREVDFDVPPAGQRSFHRFDRERGQVTRER